MCQFYWDFAHHSIWFLYFKQIVFQFAIIFVTSHSYFQLFSTHWFSIVLWFIEKWITKPTISPFMAQVCSGFFPQLSIMTFHSHFWMFSNTLVLHNFCDKVTKGYTLDFCGLAQPLLCSTFPLLWSDWLCPSFHNFPWPHTNNTF